MGADGGDVKALATRIACAVFEKEMNVRKAFAKLRMANLQDFLQNLSNLLNNLCNRKRLLIYAP